MSRPPIEDLEVWHDYIKDFFTPKQAVGGLEDVGVSDAQDWAVYAQSVTAYPEILPPFQGNPVPQKVHLRRAPPRLHRLDLHNLTQEEAHMQLEDFLERAQRQGLQKVLIITGKGCGGAPGPARLGVLAAEAPGVLQRMVPRWLYERPFCDYVARIAPAAPREGGAGALVVYLRRG